MVRGEPLNDISLEVCVRVEPAILLLGAYSIGINEFACRLVIAALFLLVNNCTILECIRGFIK